MHTIDLIGMIAGLTAVAFVALAAFVSHTQRGRVANLGNRIFRTQMPARPLPNRHGRNVAHVIAQSSHASRSSSIREKLGATNSSG